MERLIEAFEVSGIQRSNIRGFRTLDMDLRLSTGVPRKRTLIIGKNGTCKSTLLRTIALGLVEQADAGRLISEPTAGSLVSDSQAEGSIKIKLVEAGQPFPSIWLKKTIERRNDLESIFFGFERDPESPNSGRVIFHPPNPFACGYGAGRTGIGSDPGRSYRVSS